MVTTVMQNHLTKIFLLVLVFILSSCSPNSILETSKESILEKPKETVLETSKQEQIYQDRDKVLDLIDSNKILNTSVKFEHLENDFLIYVSVRNENIKLKELDSIKIGFSVESVDNEDVFTDIKNFDDTKEYYEMKLIDNNLENIYELRISKDTNLLTEIEKQLLENKDKTLVLRLDYYIDKSSPIKIHNHFLNKIKFLV